MTLRICRRFHRAAGYPQCLRLISTSGPRQVILQHCPGGRNIGLRWPAPLRSDHARHGGRTEATPTSPPYLFQVPGQAPCGAPADRGVPAVVSSRDTGGLLTSSTATPGIRPQANKGIPPSSHKVGSLWRDLGWSPRKPPSYQAPAAADWLILPNLPAARPRLVEEPKVCAGSLLGCEPQAGKWSRPFARRTAAALGRFRQTAWPACDHQLQQASTRVGECAGWNCRCFVKRRETEGSDGHGCSGHIDSATCPGWDSKPESLPFGLPASSLKEE